MRIAGVNLPDNKRVVISLTYLYGIGRRASENILNALHVDPARRANTLSQEEVGKIQSYIEKNYRVGGELRQVVKRNIERLKNLGAYRGMRHARHLPVRGQRTKTNSRTVRGNVRKTAGSGKRKVDLK